MKLFNVTTNKEIELNILYPGVDEPDSTKTSHLKLFAIQESFGSINIQQIVIANWQVWFCRYDIAESVALRLVSETPAIVMHISGKNHFEYQWQGIHMADKGSLQFNFSYSPIIDVTGSFTGGQTYETADLLLQAEMLQEFVSDYPAIDDFLRNVAIEQQAFLSGNCGMIHKIRQLVNELATFKCKPGVFIKNMKARLDIIFTLALEELCVRSPETKLLMTTDLKEKAYQAKGIIEQRLKDPPSIIELARLCTSNSHSIQFAFKELFNMTIGEYSKEVRITLAKMLLLTGAHNLDTIADETGYYDGASFSRYFKKIVGTTPGEFRKYGKLLE